MFKKLRNRFLLLNMATISALLIASFAVISVIMSRNIYSDIHDKVVMLAGAGYRSDTRSPNDRAADVEQAPPEPKGGRQEPQHSAEPRGVPGRFIIARQTDGEYNISRTAGAYSDGEEEAVYEKGVDVLSDKDEKKFTYNGGTWLVSRIGMNKNTLVFLDISTEIHIMRRLMVTFFFVGLICLLVIFFISLRFANKMIAPIAAAWEKQKQFIADASHELKTPLAAINTNIDVLLSGDSVSGEDAKWLEYIQNETERMTKLTNDLLYLARLDYKEEKVIYPEISLSEICETTVIMMEARAYEKNITVTEETAADINVRADSDTMKQVVMVLIDNAIKYTPENGCIRVNLAADGKNAVLRVSNSGAYIDSRDLEHIFDRFYRSDKSRSRSDAGGYGLGLAIAKAAVTRFGGKISADSDITAGTVFTVSLPRVQGQRAETEK